MRENRPKCFGHGDIQSGNGCYKHSYKNGCWGKMRGEEDRKHDGYIQFEMI